MNVLDQAFVKAYSRRTKPQATEPTSDRAASSANTAAGTSDVSVHPRAAKSAVLWIDPVTDQFLRQDRSHQEKATPSCDSAAGPDSAAYPRPSVSTAPPSRPTAAPSLSDASSDSTPPAPPMPLASGAADPEQADLSFLCHTQIAFAQAAEPTPTLAPATPCDPLPMAPAAFASPVTAQTPVTAPEPAPPAAAGFEPFTAAWEVDVLQLSSTITALFDTPGLSRSIGYPLDRAVNEGLQTLLITSERTGVGQTSVATGLALSAAAAGLRVALVDAASAAANGAARSLADVLNLEVLQGWLGAIRGGKSVAETAIHSIEDQLTVIPQVFAAADHGPTADEFGRLIQLLRQGFDLIVIDGPCCQEPAFETFTRPQRAIADAHRPTQTLPESSPIDAVILVQDARDADSTLAVQIMQSLKQYGITGLGRVENFT